MHAEKKCFKGYKAELRGKTIQYPRIIFDNLFLSHFPSFFSISISNNPKVLTQIDIGREKLKNIFFFFYFPLKSFVPNQLRIL